MRYLTALACFGICGCSSMNVGGPAAVPKRFVVAQDWARGTTKSDFLGYRRVNRMPPLIFKNLVLVGNSIDGLVAFNRTTGVQVWRFDVRGGVEGGAAVDGEEIYFGANDGQVYVLNANTGETSWSFPAKSESLAPPSVAGNVVYVQTGADALYALDKKTGALVWTYNRQSSSNFSIRANSRPTVDGDTVYSGFSDGYFVALRKQDGGLLWERKLGAGQRFHDVDASPAIDRDSVYVSSFDGALFALDKRSGDVQWQVDDGGYVQATLGLADSLFYSTTNGKLIRLDKKSGKPVWTKKIKQGIATQPVLYKGYLIYGESNGKLCVADSNTGNEVASFDSGHGLLARPTVVDESGETYMLSNGANVYALRVGLVRRADQLPWVAQ